MTKKRMTTADLLVKYRGAVDRIGTTNSQFWYYDDAVTAASFLWLLERGAWVHRDLCAYMVTGHSESGFGCFNTPHFPSPLEAMLWAIDRWDERERWPC